MTVGQYLKRILLMVLVAMPIGALLLTVAELRSASSESVVSVLGGAFVVVYVWGAVTGTIASIVHSALTRGGLSGRQLIGLLLGAVIGAIGGALTPTLITGFLRPGAILLGSCVGLVYAGLIPFWDGLTGNSSAAA